MPLLNFSFLMMCEPPYIYSNHIWASDSEPPLQTIGKKNIAFALEWEIGL